MAKRYEPSDEAWNLVADLFTSTHTRGRPRSSDRLMLWRAVAATLRCCLARHARVLWALANGLSPLPTLAKPGNLRADAQAIASEAQ